MNGSDACGAVSHEECEDFVLLQGQLTTTSSRVFLHGAPALQPILMPAPSLPTIVSKPTFVSLGHALPPGESPTILRC